MTLRLCIPAGRASSPRFMRRLGLTCPAHRMAPVVLLSWMVLGCAPDAGEDPTFALEVVRTAAVAQVDSLPAPVVGLEDARVVLRGAFGLGSSGYLLTASGSVEDNVVDITVHARMPDGMAGATVLTAYEYRVTSSPLPAGTYLVRVRQAMDDEGPAEVVFEGELTIR